MKNFRKVLALVLVVATLFSFTAMTSAKTYTDAADVSYKEAVDVLSAVGILNGYEDDSFKPTQTISREEMAKMIAVLANSGSDVSTLYASACGFADVPTVRWSASYVAYCNKTGIVAGRSNTTFDPTAKVTGIETAKMLLVVLGFDAEEQGYIGADWKVNILRDAKTMGLLNNFADDYDVDAAITREEAANMMLNALKAPAVVGILSKNVVTVTNALVFNSAELKGSQIGAYVKVNSYATLLDAMKAGKWALYGNVVISDDLLYTSLFKGLEFSTGVDCFGRNTTTFTYKVGGVKKAAGSYAVGATQTASTFVDVDSVYKAQKNAGYTVEVIKNGVNGVSTDWTAAETYTGNGVDTAIYVDATNKKVTVNVIENFIDKVTSISTYYGTFTTANTTGSYTIVDDVAVGDYVIFRVCQSAKHTALYGSADSIQHTGWGNVFAMHDYQVVEPVTVKVSYARNYVSGATTGAHMNDCYFKTTEGTTYQYDQNFGEIIEVGNAPEFDLPAAGDTKNVYLDKYGYVMLITDVPAAAASVAYIEEESDEIYTIYNTVVNGSKEGVKLDAAVYTGAAVANVELTELKALRDSNLVSHYADLYNNGLKTGSLVAYRVNATTGLAEMTAGGLYVKANTVISSSTQNIEAAYVNESYALTTKTVFMIRHTDAATGAWTYEEVVGRNNLTEKYSTYTNGAQVLDLNSDGYADYVFIDAKFVKTASEYFVLGTEYVASWTGVAGLGVDQYKAYRALVNGVESLVLFDVTGTQPAKGGLYTGAIAYKGVALVEDQNLNLYVATAGAQTAVTNKTEIEKVNVVVKGDEVWVETKDSSNNVKTTEIAGTEKLPVYHILKAGSLNDNTGYWIQYNSIDKTLMGSAAEVYFVRSAGEIVALYVVHTGWDA